MKLTKIHTLITALAILASSAHAQDPAHATEFRKPTPGPGPNGESNPTFLAHRLGTDHAEAITTLDMNGDGYPDLLSGAYWYENPGPHGGDWKQHQYRTVGIHNEFVSDCGEWTIDVNHDGYPDVVTTGWISNGVWWYENPGKSAAPGALWQKHFITDSFDTEGGAIGDLDGDGHPDIALAHYNHSGILWISFANAKPEVHHVGGREQDGHGIGIADIDGDGKADILTPYGWFQNIDAAHDKWQWHPDWHLGDAGFPILAYDVNHDGKIDIIYGQGHSYGLYWLEQGGTPEHRTWTRHTIDESFSQSHALKLADLDGDGSTWLITGKRYRGHSGGDPGSYDPLVIYAYKINHDGTFTRVPISVNGTAGVGTQILAEDLDKDGDLDLAVAGKSGVHFLENLRINNNVPKSTRESQQILNRDWPFPGEGEEVPQEDGPSMTKQTGQPAQTLPLENTHWQLTQLGTTPITADPQRGPNLTLDSQSHRASGAGGCNRIMGGYTLHGNQLKFAQMASTMMACANTMDTEQAFLKALSHVETWKITNNQLELLDVSGKTLATFKSTP